ncbi:MAG: wax ester/triacylglycerol synthase family O-acyltransferase [Arenimonas sp.]|nr:wax ester/triacylglycerol synthase family O-acyltransferase [Arenimonas sp.]MBP6310109.1 wax ester/triacylglycerol synthase family O-acyltransferase [Arenimonas sp.]
MSKRLRSLSGLDAGFLYLESAGTPMHVGSVMLIEVPKSRTKKKYDFQAELIQHLQDRLPRAAALRRVLKETPLDLAHPMWVDVEQIDLKKHVLKKTLAGNGGLRKLHTLTGKLHASMLDRSLPMWQFVVIENVEPGVIALYSKIHHALLDGQGGVALAQVLLDIEAKAPNKTSKKKITETTEAPRLRKRDVTQTALRSTVNQFAKLLRAMPSTLKLAGEVGSPSALKNLRDSILLAPRTPFNQQISKTRSYATVSVPVATVKRVARGFNVSLNDVVMAMCSGALRDMLIKTKQLPKQSLIAAMPVSLREKGNTDSNNQISMVQCSLATDIAEPIARLQAIQASTAQIKKRVATFKNMIPTDFPGLAAPIWASGLSRIWASGRIAEKLPPLANVIISNVPGPPISLYLAGAKLKHYYPASIVTHGLALNITVQTYAGFLEFGITACANIVKKPEQLAAALAQSLNELTELLPE